MNILINFSFYHFETLKGILEPCITPSLDRILCLNFFSLTLFIFILCLIHIFLLTKKRAFQVANKTTVGTTFFKAKILCIFLNSFVNAFSQSRRENSQICYIWIRSRNPVLVVPFCVDVWSQLISIILDCLQKLKTLLVEACYGWIINLFSIRMRPQKSL